MSSSSALACRTCTDCGLGPSQSFRADFGSASSSLPRTLSSPFLAQRRQNARWAVSFGRACNKKRGVSMEYGGSANTPPSLVGEREMISGVQMLQNLRKQLLEAINMEDYSEAARVRDFINIVVSQDPILSTREALERAISEERYDDAAKLRDELNSLTPPEEEPASVVGGLGNSSDTLTQGIRVRVKSGYVMERSDPSKQQFFFAYRIRISNEGTRTVQLLHRHWVITDATGRTEEVRGPGVIGEQPVLRAGNEFEYTSACPLRTPAGKMEGEYQMIHVDSDDPAPFAVAIGPFALRMEDDEENGVGFQ